MQVEGIAYVIIFFCSLKTSSNYSNLLSSKQVLQNLVLECVPTIMKLCNKSAENLTILLPNVHTFSPQDFGDLKGFFQTQFHKELKEVEFCVKGWNWGEAKFRGSLLSFMVDSKPAFEIPLKEVSQVGWVGGHVCE